MPTEGLGKIEDVPIYAHIADKLRGMIISGSIPPGTSLPTERDLAVDLGVSRASVREALRVLQAEGLVAGSGRTSPLRTTIPDENDRFLRKALSAAVRLRQVSLEDLLDLRCVVEGAAVEMAAERAAKVKDAKIFEEAEECLARLCEPGLSLEEFDPLDVEFHLAMDAIADNEALYLVMSAISGATADKLLETLISTRASKSTFKKLNDEHRQIFEAIKAGKGRQARELLVAHVMGFYHSTKRAK